MPNDTITRPFSNAMQRRTSATPEQLLASQGRIPPQAVDLEEVVLGALMLEQKAVNDVIDILTPEAFYKEAHQKISRPSRICLASRNLLIFLLLPMN